MTVESIVKLRQSALVMAVELAKLKKNPDMDVTAKAKELYEYMDKGTIVLRAGNPNNPKG